MSDLQQLLLRAEKAEADRDALLEALGFKPGPLIADRHIILKDATGLRPAMVEARRERDQARLNHEFAWAYAAQAIRPWIKERFGKWVTYKTANTLVDRIFATEAGRLAISNSGEG